MYSIGTVRDFFTDRTIAVVGVSRSGKKFGNIIFNELSSRGFTVYPVNPGMKNVGGTRCYPSLKDLPKKVKSVVIAVPPLQTELVLRDGAAAGVQRVWLQRGSESERAIQFCREQAIDVVSDQCILMFAEPVRSFHRVHRWVWKMIGKYPT